MKKLVSMVAGVALSLSLFAGSSLAASGWGICTPVKIGPATPSALFQVSGCSKNVTGANTLGFMALNPADEDQQLAVILTAMSLGKTVSIQFDDAQTSGNKNILLGITLNQ